MLAEQIIQLTIQGLMLCLYLSLPVIVVSAGTGLLVSFVQAVTSLQDQSISYGIKLVAVVLTVAVTSPWVAAQLLQFGNTALSLAFI